MPLLITNDDTISNIYYDLEDGYGCQKYIWTSTKDLVDAGTARVFQCQAPRQLSVKPPDNWVSNPQTLECQAPTKLSVKHPQNWVSSTHKIECQSPRHLSVKHPDTGLADCLCVCGGVPWFPELGAVSSGVYHYCRYVAVSLRVLIGKLPDTSIQVPEYSHT